MKELYNLIIKIDFFTQQFAIRYRYLRQDPAIISFINKDLRFHAHFFSTNCLLK